MRAVFNVGKLLVVLLIAWLLVLVFLTGPLLRNNESEEALAKKLLETQGEVSALQKERDQLRKSLRDNTGDAHEIIHEDKLDNDSEGPSNEYENYRRRAFRDTQELWFFARSRLEGLAKDKSKLEQKIPEILSELETREQVVLTDLEMMKENDGHDDWRKQESLDLSNLVQARLKYLQNPENCGSARKLICNLNKGWVENNN